MLRLAFTLSTLFIVHTAQSQNETSIQYYRLEGLIGKSPVVMHLHRLERVVDASEPDTSPYSYYSGTYYYSKYGAPIRFDGQKDSMDVLVLSEMVGWNVTGTFYLDKDYKGTWKSGDGSRVLPVSLKERYPVGVTAFDGRARSDQYMLAPETPGSPAISTSIFWLEPGEKTLPSIRNWLNAQNAGVLLGEADTASQQDAPVSVEAAYITAQLRWKDFFVEDMKALDWQADSTLPEYLSNYDFEFQNEVLYNEPGLLSMGYTHYNYTGGAHGMYATAVASYDLERRQQIRLEDILNKGYDRALQIGLDQAARQRAGLSPGDPLSSTYFVDEIPLTENFYLTEKGLVFSYPPYEIASYADGQVELFVPFSILKPWLRDAWK